MTIRDYNKSEIDENKNVKNSESQGNDDFILENDFTPLDEDYNSHSAMNDDFKPKNEDEHNEINFNYNFEPWDEGENQPLKFSKQAKNNDNSSNLHESITSDINYEGVSFKLSHNQKIGSISELSLIRDLERNGKNVSIPYGDFQRYDLLIEEKGKISRVQVKTANERDNRFPIYSISSKGGLKSYKGEIEYFGVYLRNENKSFLIPMEEIEDVDKIRTIKLDDSLRNRFEIKNEKLNRISGEKISDSFINKSINLTKEEKIVLAQLGRRDENTIICDSIVKNNNGTYVHKIDEIKTIDGGKFKETNIEVPNKIEISRSNVAADLMINGFIISTPVADTPKYDYIIQQKYGRKQLKSEVSFYKVKIIEENFHRKKPDKMNKDIDYFGIYNEKMDKSYLIPTHLFNSGLKDYQSYEIKRENNLLKEMTPADRGDVTEMRIGAEFMKYGYNVLHPIVGRPPLDLVVKQKNKYYTIEVKTGRIHYEKDSTYTRFDIASRKPKINKDHPRISYKGKIDFIASFNQDNLKNYIVPVDDLPNNDAKLKLDERENMRRMHHGTLRAKNYEFSNIDEIVRDFEVKKRGKINTDRINQEIENMPSEKREKIENQQILDVLKGNMEVADILSTNLAIKNYVTRFKELNPKSNLEYQGVLGVTFRDFLISQPDLKSQINNRLKEEGLFGKGEIKHQIVYDFFDTFYNENNRGPNTLELYQTFLNFKSHELRGKINVVRKNYPHYYEEYLNK